MTTTPTAPARTTSTEPPWGKEQHRETMLATYSELTTAQRRALRACSQVAQWPSNYRTYSGKQYARRTLAALVDLGLIAWVSGVGYKPTEMGQRVLAARFGYEAGR